MIVRKIFMVLCFLIGVLGCESKKNTDTLDSFVLNGIVVESAPGILLVASVDDNEMYYFSLDDTVIYNTNDCLNIEYISENKTNEIHVQSIQKNELSLVSMYLQVIDELMLRDQGINSNNKILSLNMEGTHLSEKDINFIGDILKIRYGFEEVVKYSYDELVSQGLITGIYPCFENGLLINIRESESDSNELFLFDVMKYKGSLAGYYSNDCVARYTKNGWKFEIGTEAIS